MNVVFDDSLMGLLYPAKCGVHHVVDEMSSLYNALHEMDPQDHPVYPFKPKWVGVDKIPDEGYWWLTADCRKTLDWDIVFRLRSIQPISDVGIAGQYVPLVSELYRELDDLATTIKAFCDYHEPQLISDVGAHN